jgi:hypothetical protein
MCKRPCKGVLVAERPCESALSWSAHLTRIWSQHKLNSAITLPSLLIHCSHHSTASRCLRRYPQSCPCQMSHTHSQSLPKSPHRNTCHPLLLLCCRCWKRYPQSCPCQTCHTRSARHCTQRKLSPVPTQTVPCPHATQAEPCHSPVLLSARPSAAGG